MNKNILSIALFAAILSGAFLTIAAISYDGDKIWRFPAIIFVISTIAILSEQGRKIASYRSRLRILRHDLNQKPLADEEETLEEIRARWQ